MKSQVFFLVTVLLVCSSYANDIPEVSSNVHRKLIVGAFLKGALKKMTPANSKKTVPKNIPGTPKNIFGTPESVPAVLKTPPKKTNSVPKDFIANKAEQFLGPDAKRGFRVGFKIGKEYYSVQNECQQTLECKPASRLFPCYRPTMSSCLPFCVVEVQVNNGTRNCSQTFGEPPIETPCTFSSGVLYLKNESIPYDSYRTECVFN
uniref:uncharacterized protein LOC122586098 n=1 Tax=Erigeron canadensis TaxID=72917 RepID=UPI001CB985CB|nr:uncharacterized protein LOC122586098 [Erigeron canadensis]